MSDSSVDREDRGYPLRRVLLVGVVFVIGFMVVGAIGIQVWDFTNSTYFCSYVCHAVHPEEPEAYQDSYHARVKCTECHMGRVNALQGMVLKASHARHVPEVLFGLYERPLESETLRPANESCERCHWPPAFHGDRVREIKHYQPDEFNTLERTYLILKTGGGQRERGLGYGIHWHIENRVEFITRDGEHKQEIPWVRTTLPDGRTVEYVDTTDPVSPEEIEAAQKYVMDCVDCHNRVGHPFPPPDRLIDQALSENRLAADLPFVKREMVQLLTASYENREAALEEVEALSIRYKATYPRIAASREEDIEAAKELAVELVPRLVFEESGITWESFADNGGHKYFAGCFRCHDGKHLSADGESIRLHCNICHSIPEVVKGGSRPPQMPVATLEEPPSHLETNFIADHRFQADDSCAACHGEIQFGADDSSFCSNSACHGQAWPSVDLDAAFPHPIPLAGAHAEVWCHDCHNGVKKPSYECANCHEPPTDPHLGPQCEECHTPEGWAWSAASLVERAPTIAHPLDGRNECLMCHDPEGKVQPAPPSHKGWDSGQCVLCHRLTL